MAWCSAFYMNVMMWCLPAIDGMTVALKTVAISRGSNVDGVLIYAALRSMPSELLTQAPNGTIIGRESYGG